LWIACVIHCDFVRILLYRSLSLKSDDLPPREVAVLTKVLVIDDDKEMTELLKVILEPNNFDVIAANSGQEGIVLIREQNPDVVVLDLLMPDMDGWQVCKEIRSFSQVPILVLSAISKPGMVARALDEGADDFLLKPMPGGVLTAHIKKLARRARAEQGSSKSRLGYYV
jgi:DNA-binding response OmpR family regulator